VITPLDYHKDGRIWFENLCSMKTYDPEKPFLYLIIEGEDPESEQVNVLLIPRGMDIRQEAREWMESTVMVNWQAYMSFRVEQHVAIFDAFHPMFRLSGWHHMEFSDWLLHRGAEVAGDEHLLQLSGRELAA